MDKKTMDPAKEFLRRYTTMSVRLKSLIASIDAAYDRMTKCTYTLNPIKVQGGNGAYDRMAEDVAIRLDGIQMMQQECGAINVALCEIMHAIQAVPDETAKTVLTLRYVEGLKWEDVCIKSHYEESQMHYYHRIGLRHVRKWLKDRSKSQ